MTAFWLAVYIVILCALILWLWREPGRQAESWRDQHRAERARVLADLQADFQAKQIHHAIKGHHEPQ